MLTHVGRVLVRLGQLAEADALLEQALELARENGDELRAGHTEIAREFVRLQLEPEEHSGKIVDVTERLEPLFDEHDDDLGLAHTWRLRSEVGRLVCRFARGGGCTRAGTRARGAAGDEREGAEIRLWLGTCLCYGPTPVSAAHRPLPRDARAGTRGPLGRGVDPRHARLPARDGRRPSRGPRLPRAQRAIFEELGMTFPHAARAVNSARIEMMAGDLAAAERQLRWGYEQLEADRRERSAFDDRGDARPGPPRAGPGRRGGAVRADQRELRPQDDVDSQVLWRSALAKVRARRDGL